MPKKIAVIVDSSSGLTKAQAAEHGLHFQPLQIIHEGQETLNDGIDIEKERLYEMIENGDKLTTSQSSMGENLKMVENLLTTYDQVICVPISSGLSSAYSTWKTVEEQVENGRLHVIDAKTISATTVDLAKKIKEHAENSKGRGAIDEFASQYASHTYGLLVCNDFNRLVKGGRVGAIRGTLATLLKMHSLIEFSEGKLQHKSTSRSEEKLIKMIKPTIYEKLGITEEKQINKIYFLHTFPEKSKKQMELVLEKVKEEFGANIKIEIQNIPAVVACHVGLNSFAVLVNKKLDY